MVYFFKIWNHDEKNSDQCKAIDALFKSLSAIARQSSDARKVEKANNILSALQNRRADKNMKRIIHKNKSNNSGTSNLQFVSDGLQISNLASTSSNGRKRAYTNKEELPQSDLSDEVDNFFKSPAEKKSSNLFLNKLQKSEDETDNEGGEINHRAEKHKRNESPRCSDCDMEINISELMRYCPYCGSKIMSFEVESDLEALDYDETDEENVADDINESNDTPPKVDPDGL